MRSAMTYPQDNSIHNLMKKGGNLLRFLETIHIFVNYGNETLYNE